MAAASLLLILLLSFVFIPFTEGDGALWEAHQILRGEGEDRFGSWRLGVWRLTAKLAAAHLLFGTGPDTFWYVFNPAWAEYEAQLRESGLSQNEGEWLERFDNPHNEFLAILSNNGLPALLLYLAFLFVLFRRAFLAEETCTLKKAAAIGALLFIIQGLFSFSNCLVSPVFWALAGLAANTKI